MKFSNRQKMLGLAVLLAVLICFNTLAVQAAQSIINENLIANGDFESGKDGSWTESADLIAEVGAAGMDTHSGDWLAWMGGLGTDITTLSQTVAIPAGEPLLSFWYMVESEDVCNYDYLRVSANGTQVFEVTLCTDNATWEYAEVSLADFDDQSVTIEFSVDLDESFDSNLFLDDVSLTVAADNWQRLFIPLALRGLAQSVTPTGPTVTPTVTSTPTTNPGGPRNGYYLIAANGQMTGGSFTVLNGVITNFAVGFAPNANIGCNFSKVTANLNHIPVTNNQFSFSEEGGDYTGSGTFSSQTAASGTVHAYKDYTSIPVCPLQSYSITLPWTAAWSHD